MMTPPDASPRRTFLSWLLGGTLASVLAPVAYVAARYLRLPNRLPASVNLGPASSMAPGSSRIIKIGLTDAIVLRRDDGSFDAFNLRCTHAGCNVSWKGDVEQFHCPCHDGLFDRNGQVVDGPPKRELERLVVVEVGGNMQVTKPG
jgi:cytochrome b6-f complex iron-sulfur subunit